MLPESFRPARGFGNIAEHPRIHVGWAGQARVALNVSHPTRLMDRLDERLTADPAKVVRSALEHSASIVGLMLTTEAVVTELKDEEKHVEGAASLR